MTNFSRSLFENTSFIATKFKFCSFYGVKFESCLFKGTLFRKCNLTNTIFKNCIIKASNFDRSKIKDCKFYDCKILKNSKDVEKIPESNLINTIVLQNSPKISLFDPKLVEVVENLRSNAYIRKSQTLHRKKGLLDTVSLKILVSQYDEQFLIDNLPKLPSLISNDFHTLSYIQKKLNDLKI